MATKCASRNRGSIEPLPRARCTQVLEALLAQLGRTEVRERVELALDTQPVAALVGCLLTPTQRDRPPATRDRNSAERGWKAGEKNVSKLVQTPFRSEQVDYGAGRFPPNSHGHG